MTTPENTPENLQACRCPGCPSYPHDNKKFYCGIGKSGGEILHKGCSCVECPVRTTYHFQALYLCRGGKIA